jgi:hypothetical protein
VLPDLRHARIGEQRRERGLERLARQVRPVLVRDRQVDGRLAPGEPDAHEARAQGILRRRLGVDDEARGQRTQPLDQRGQLGGIGDHAHGRAVRGRQLAGRKQLRRHGRHVEAEAELAGIRRDQRRRRREVGGVGGRGAGLGGRRGDRGLQAGQRFRRVLLEPRDPDVAPERGELRRVELLHLELGPGLEDCEVVVDRHQVLREERRVAMLEQLLAHALLLDLGQAVVQRLERAELRDQLDRGLLADAGHAGHVCRSSRP